MNKYIIIIVTTIILLSGASVFYNSQKEKIASSNSDSNTLIQKLIPETSITHGHGLAVDATNSNKIYIATHHGLFVLINDKDLYAVGENKDDYMGFSPNPKDANVFFSSGHPGSGGNIGFQKSVDGGFTWKKISNGLNGPVDFHAMAISPVNPDIAYGWFQGNIQRSTDGGRTWVKFPTPAPYVALAGDTKDENIVYAASPLGLFKSQNKGETWEKLFEGFVSAIAVHPTLSQTLIVSSEKYGLAKSTDGGKTWIKNNQNFNGESPLFIAFDRQKPEILYFLTEKNGLYKSTDSGDNWNKIR